MIDLSNAPDAPSPGAERMRRHRELRRQGAVNINLLVGADATATLAALGWLHSEERGNRNAVTAAVIDIATRALALRVTPKA